MSLLPSSAVGRKIVMAVTGQVLLLFVIIHMLGNSLVFFSGLNAYAEKLHSMPPLVWLTRMVMLASLVLHVFYSIQLTLENKKAKQDSYAVQKHMRSTFASRNMIWTGSVVGLFLIYHLLHFTIQIVDPATSAVMNVDSLGRPDVSAMIIAGFQNMMISFIYIAAMVALVFHLSHGVQSSVQTLGLNNDRTLPAVTRAGSITAVILFLGYISIPVVIALGFMKG